MSELKDLLNPLFNELQRLNIEYCICGNYQALPEETSHDVDIWAKDTKILENILFGIAQTKGFILCVHYETPSGSSNIFYKSMHDSIELIRIDILKECAWFSVIPLVRVENIERSRIKFKNFYVADETTEAVMHLLYPLIKKGIVKDKYKDKISNFCDDQKFRSLLSEALGSRMAKKMISWISQKDWGSVQRSIPVLRLKVTVRAIFAKDFLLRVKCFYNFARLNLKRLFWPSGIFIVFIGPDGSGKTTIIKQLVAYFKRVFLEEKIKVFYWRPFFLPHLAKLFFLKTPADSKGENKNPYLNNAFIFLLKYIYYWLDYLVGRMKYQAAWSWGGIVLFDRYYYDHMVYPKRFGFFMPAKFMEFLERFIPQPDIIFYLYAPPEILISRKQELSMAEIKRQDILYSQLISKLPNSYPIDTSLPLPQVEREIAKLCLDHMAGLIKKRLSIGSYIQGLKYFCLGDRTQVAINLSNINLKNDSDMIILLKSSRTPLFIFKKFLNKNNYEISDIYMIMPSFHNPRWFFPLNKTIITNAGNIVKPLRLRSVIGWIAVRLFNKIGYPQFVVSSQLIIATKMSLKAKAKGLLKQYLQNRFPTEKNIDFILYTGTQGYDQKFTAQIVNADRIVGFAKIGNNLHAKELILNEEATLKSLQKINFSSFVIPEVVSVENLPDTEDTIVLFRTQSLGKYRNLSCWLTSLHAEATAELFLKTAKQGQSANDILSDFRKAVPSHSLLDSSLNNLEENLKSVNLTTGLSHGDFSPWNIYRSVNQLYIFDWEKAAYRVPLWDIYNFIIHSEALIFSKSSREIIKAIFNKNGIYNKHIEYYKSSLGKEVYCEKAVLLKFYLVGTICYYLDYQHKQISQGLQLQKETGKLIKTLFLMLKETINYENTAC